jgi:TetR/AcrR family transcriptional regulator, tetracycline repressor protein
MTSTVPQGRPGAGRTLSEDEILDATLSLLDEGGVAAASVRGIAGRVGVAPNAVYTYFPDKTAVLSALVERLLGEVDQEALADRSTPWRERVEFVALELRSRLMAHPGAVTLMSGGRWRARTRWASGSGCSSCWPTPGLDPTEAARASYLLITYLFGSMALEVAELAEPGPPPPEPERVAARLIGYSAVPAEAFPRTAAAAETLARYISTEQYLWGLRRVLDGIDRTAAPVSR